MKIGPSGENINFNQFSFPKMNLWIVIPAILLIFVIYTFSDCYYTVGQEEQSIVLRFGKVYTKEQPGLHFKIPYIDKVILIKTGRNMKEEFGYRSINSRNNERSNYAKKGYEDESLCLTGDLNVCDIEWTVQYMITDPYKYLFSIKEPVKAIRDISEAATRKIIGNANVTDVLTTERSNLASKILKDMQTTLEKYDIGIKVVNFNFQDVNPPSPVKPAYNSVNQAEQQKESAIQNAQQLYNQQIPKAKGEAKEKIQLAEGYALERVNQAKGDVQAFLAVLNEYKKSPEVTKKRIYIETMEKILPRVQELYLLDGINNNSNNVLPLLNLNESKEVTK